MLRNPLHEKLLGRKGQAGETLVETLVAMTVAGLSMIMLAMTIAVSTNIVSKGSTTAENYYAGNNALTQPANSGASVQVTEGTGAAATTSSPISVNYYLYNDMPGGGTGVSYTATALVEG